jgi:flavin reductase (DIM6/NTAB) family NADH-FMN oxidoreductase RutF
MAKVEISTTDYLKETLEVMGRDGLLLVTSNPSGRPNVMTIGWGTIGQIWGRPIFVSLVRPSRYTYELIEKTGKFTINVPSRDLSDVVLFCGTVSGRDRDKFKERGLTAIPGRRVTAPIIEECVIHYECTVVHANDVLRDTLGSDVASSYPAGDYHRIYFGEILTAYADSDVQGSI